MTAVAISSFAVVFLFLVLSGRWRRLPRGHTACEHAVEVVDERIAFRAQENVTRLGFFFIKPSASNVMNREALERIADIDFKLQTIPAQVDQMHVAWLRLAEHAPVQARGNLDEGFTHRVQTILSRECHGGRLNEGYVSLGTNRERQRGARRQGAECA